MELMVYYININILNNKKKKKKTKTPIEMS